MDNQTQPNIPPLQPQPQTPTLPSINWVKIILFVLLGLIIVASSIYAGIQIGKNKTPNQQSVAVQPTASPTQIMVRPTASPTNVSSTINPTQSLPSGWEYKLSQQQNNANDCVKFALPPMDEPYIYTLNENRQPSVTEDKGSGRFWYLGGGAYPNLLSKILGKGQEYKQTMAIFATEMEGSGYMSQAVEVSCVGNLGKMDNTTLLSNLKTNIEDFNKSTGEKGMEANKYNIQTSKNVNRWGKSVVDLTVSEYFENSGGQPYTNSVNYTILATPQFLYEVRVFGASNDAFVKETSQKIFDNLLFN